MNKYIIVSIVLCSFFASNVFAYTQDAFDRAKKLNDAWVSFKNKTTNSNPDNEHPGVRDLNGLDLSVASLTKFDLTDAVLSNANLTGAGLYNAILHGADLTNATLTGANLSWADLTSANFANANLTGANLTYATLLGADFNGAIGLSTAQKTAAKKSGAINVPN